VSNSDRNRVPPSARWAAVQNSPSGSEEEIRASVKRLSEKVEKHRRIFDSLPFEKGKPEKIR
jgi:hypothetical protein